MKRANNINTIITNNLFLVTGTLKRSSIVSFKLSFFAFNISRDYEE